MTDRETFFETVHFGRPDRMLCETPYYTVSYLGANHESFEDPDNPDGKNSPTGTTWTDIWGTGWVKEHPDVMGFPRVFPLSDMSALDSYTWPDPQDERICGRIYEGRSKYSPDADMVLAGLHRDTLWEKSYMLVGMENMMDYFFSEPYYARTVLHKIMDFQMGIAEHYSKVGVDVVLMSDDLGCQDRLLISPQMIHEFFVPEYRRLFDFYKKKGVLVDFHSCGYVEPLLELFIDLGVDILNPMQATANNLHNVVDITKGRMAIRGGVSSKVIMEGNNQEIIDAVYQSIHILGAYGGYFCQQDQGMPYPPGALDVLKNAVTCYPVH